MKYVVAIATLMLALTPASGWDFKCDGGQFVRLTTICDPPNDAKFIVTIYPVPDNQNWGGVFRWAPVFQWNPTKDIATLNGKKCRNTTFDDMKSPLLKEGS